MAESMGQRIEQGPVPNPVNQQRKKGTEREVREQTQGQSHCVWGVLQTRSDDLGQGHSKTRDGGMEEGSGRRG